MEIKKIIGIVCLNIVFITGVNAKQDHPQFEYRPAHKDICYRIQTFDVSCGNFSIHSGTVRAPYYINAGADSMASFSVESHPGDYPFLKRQAMKLGYLGEGASPQLAEPIATWRDLDQKTQNTLINLLSEKVKASSLDSSFKLYFRQCMSYWSSAEAEYEPIAQPVKIGEVASLCLVEAGIVQKVDRL